MPPKEPNDEERLEELPDDYDTPFNIPDEAREIVAGPDNELYMTSKLGATHPATDSGLELAELYDEGLSGAAEAAEPNIGDMVIGYQPVQNMTRRDKAMATTKQRDAARKNIQKAQATWRAMTPRKRALAQPQGRSRALPGTQGGGEYYRIVVRPKSDFVMFRYHDIGEKGHLQRLAGKRSSGSWATQSWLVGKTDAHVVGGVLVADTKDARDLLMRLGSEPKHEKGDVFSAKDRPNVPERLKPTPAQQKAWAANIKKAQAARHRQAA